MAGCLSQHTHFYIHLVHCNPCLFIPESTNVNPIFKSLFIPVCLITFAGISSAQVPTDWKYEWPDTDFSRSSINYSEVISGGPPKDGIPAIDDPQFDLAEDVRDVAQSEPVIVLKLGNEARAYPFRILMWHEIVNDTIQDRPVTVTYCPLCNAAVVFDRRVNGMVLDFGVSGKLRHSDMIMYDRQTESWWQQFLGVGIVGEMTNVELIRLPARVMPFSEFKRDYPDGKVLISSNPGIRPYGKNPYVNYDSSRIPFLYKGRYNGPGSPMSYVVSVENQAWLLSDLRAGKRITRDDITIEWQEGMNSALDDQQIEQGRDIGFVRVMRSTGNNNHEDIPYDMTFAFVFMAFHPEGIIHESD